MKKNHANGLDRNSESKDRGGNKRCPTLSESGGRTAALLVTTVCILGSVSTVWVHAQTQNDVDQSPVRFAAVDVFIDSGDASLAAYQFELTVKEGNVKIVGVEGGAHKAFEKPPYYDPKALHDEDRVIIAAYNTGDDLPTSKTRVARVHVQITGELTPNYAVQLIVAASENGETLDATATVAEGK
ncbi:MAG: hypothetical protein MI923_20665 [Phycisphaerales bacterium]|nr:hypothetical protein [Phycisphaerales bacterium]